MKVLIIEDEHYAVMRLKELLYSIDSSIEILEDLDSVASAREWLSTHTHPDLCFCDIQLGDGLSFDIFKGLDYAFPLIFTTAFDEYALDAFSVNSIDYLLKPIDPEALSKALNKYKTLGRSSHTDFNKMSLMMESLLHKEKYKKKRFLVKKGNAFAYINVDEIAVFYSEDGISLSINKEGDRFIIDFTLDQIMGMLDNNIWFRISRKHIININYIQNVKPYVNQRCIIQLKNLNIEGLVVSRDKVKSFKNWIDS